LFKKQSITFFAPPTFAKNRGNNQT